MTELFLLGFLAMIAIALYRLSPKKEPCRDCEALSLSESRSLPPTPHQIEHAHVDPS